MFKKIGEAIEFGISAIQDPNSVIPMIDDHTLDAMQKHAAGLKRIAPKADDFLYFAAVMMHAAEAAIINDDGSPKLTRNGEPVTAHWDTSGGSWRWVCNDPTIKPCKNSNGDIFPEAELVKAHKKWKEKPLCIDHKSNSVDHTRGIIVDTYYDRNLKRVIALCALDKHNYPELAKKVSSGLSNSVSMGTGVGRAICYDCGRVARAEQDFCSHMQTKSCYGEINVDLSPLELSIVVNGADPNAKIKHIIASANAMNDYLELKQKEMAKISTAAPEGIAKIKQDLEDALSKLSKLEEDAKDTNNVAISPTASSMTMKSVETEGDDFSLAPPVERLANDQKVANKLTLLKEAFNRQLQELNKMANELSNFTSTGNEETMSGKTDELKAQGYFQGGGGLNEPTPGQPKYPKDPMQEDLREKEDKQMVGAKPFPEVGSPESLYGDNKDLEIKNLHSRATAEDRALRREAVVQKAKETLAYFQGGGGVNEPALHKVKYPADKMQDQLREKEDKQMVGQKPFPEVGDLDGLHPSPASVDQKDELKRKELLHRASLKAKFVKATKNDGSVDLAKSAWQVWEGDKILLTATVDEITGGRSEALYNTVATQAFAKDLMGKVRAHGADKAAALFKSAQAPALPPAPAGDAPEVPGDLDAGKTGDPKETAMSLLEKARDALSDAIEVVKALLGEQSEMGDEMAPMPTTASQETGKVSTAVLHSMRKELNTGLTAALNEVVTSLKTNEQDLSTLVSMYEDGGVVNEKNKGYINTIAEETFDSTRQTLDKAAELLAAFAIYARGAEVITKSADEAPTTEGTDLMAMIDDTHKEIEAVAQLVDDAQDADDALQAMLADDLAGLDMEDAEDALAAEADADANDVVMTSDPAKAAELAKKDPTLPVQLAQAATKEERLALRAKLASEMKWNPVMYEFHPKGGATTHLDVKPEGDLAVVEDLEETHDKMYDVAVSPPKVRKEAAEIQKLVAEGSLNPATDLDILIANGVDPETVKYWKQFYGQAGAEGSQFAAELVKEHAKAQLEDEMNRYRVKIARAYEVAYDMVDRDLLPRDRQAISKQVSELMQINDEGFESYKKVIARHAPAMDKRAARLPQVGLVGSGESFGSAVEAEDLASQLASAFSNTSKRVF